MEPNREWPGTNSIFWAGEQPARDCDNYSGHVIPDEMGKGEAEERELVKRLSEYSGQEIIRT